LTSWDLNTPEIGTLKIDQIILKILMPPINVDLLWSAILRRISGQPTRFHEDVLFHCSRSP